MDTVKLGIDNVDGRVQMGMASNQILPFHRKPVVTDPKQKKKWAGDSPDFYDGPPTEEQKELNKMEVNFVSLSAGEEEVYKIWETLLKEPKYFEYIVRLVSTLTTEEREEALIDDFPDD